MRTGNLILALALAAPLAAQSPKLPPNIENLAKRAKETTEVTLDGPLLKLTARFLSDKDADSDEAKAKRALSGIDGIYVRSFQFDRDEAYNEADLNELRAQYKSPEWFRIVGVHSMNSGDNADVFLKITPDGMLSGVTIVSANPRELAIVSIVGNIDPAQLIDLGGRYHIPRLDINPKNIKRMEP